MQEQAKSYSHMRREFYEKYRKTIVPCVKRYENKRRISLFAAILTSSLLVVIGGFFVFIEGAYYNLDTDTLQLALYCFVLSFMSWFWIKKKFENKIKTMIMPIVCSCFENLTWTEGAYYGDNIFVDSSVVSDYTNSTYDDVFEGSYNNVKIDIVEAKYTEGSGKNETTVFDGVIIKLSMNKKFQGHTIIKPDSLFHLSPNHMLNHTTLEDVNFEKKYDVYTDNEVEARYLITPSFMERLMNIKTAFVADKLSCAFYNENLIIAIPKYEDLFSLCSLVKPIDDAQQYFQMYEEILSIMKLIDHFKLNQKIGL